MSQPHRGAPRGRAAPSGQRGGRGGGSSGGGGGGAGNTAAPVKKENILDLSKYADKKIIVKFTGGREVTGTLKGYDQLLNLVLDDVKEKVADEEGNPSTRPLGLVVARGTMLTSISPEDGSEEIANPFAAGDEEEGAVLA